MKYDLFKLNKIYTEDEINGICQKNNFYTTDCIKDDNQITVSEFEDSEPIYEFALLRNRKFRLTWKEKREF